MCVCVPEGGFRGSCWPGGGSTFCKLAIVYSILGLSTDARVQAQCLLPCVWSLHEFGRLFQHVLADDLVLWRRSHLCPACVNGPGQQNPTSTAGPSPHSRTQPPSMHLHHAIFLQFTLCCLHIFPELFTAKKIQRKDIDCVQYVLSFSFLYLSCILYCKQDSMKLYFVSESFLQYRVQEEYKKRNLKRCWIVYNKIKAPSSPSPQTLLATNFQLARTCSSSCRAPAGVFTHQAEVHCSSSQQLHFIQGMMQGQCIKSSKGGTQGRCQKEARGPEGS